MMELRTYSLASPDVLNRYTTDFWPRHIRSLRKYGITVHGVWTDTDPDGPRVIALIGYPPGADPALLAQTYRDSGEFATDHADFDVSCIIAEQTLTLEAIPCSPLQ